MRRGFGKYRFRNSYNKDSYDFDEGAGGGVCVPVEEGWGRGGVEVINIVFYEAQTLTLFYQ